MSARRTRKVKPKPELNKKIDDMIAADPILNPGAPVLEASAVPVVEICELGTRVKTTEPVQGIPSAILARPGGNSQKDLDAALAGMNPTVLSLIAEAANDSNSAAKREKTSLELLYSVPKAGNHRVTLLRDVSITYPELYISVFVQADLGEEAQFAEMFSRAYCKRAKSVLEADLVVFGGGVDVDPSLYGELKHPTTSFSEIRDTDDINLYLLCVEHGIPMLGICRGAQFLHVMNQGKLYQDVDGHQGSHSLWDIRNQRLVDKVSSVHHQMVMPNMKNGMEIVATVQNKSKTRWLNPTQVDKGNHTDIEAFFYRETCCIGIQGHPEYKGYPHFTAWSLNLINDLVMMNPDIDWAGPDKMKNRRVKPDLLAQRGLGGFKSITADAKEKE